MTRLKEALDLARKTEKNRRLDAIMLTIGANDIGFAGLVANIITEDATERSLFERGGLFTDVSDAQKALDSDLPGDFAKLRGALKPYLGGNLQRVIYVTYGNPAMANGGQICQGGRGGFDIHPAFNADSKRLRSVSDFVEGRFFPKLRALATCDTPGPAAIPSPTA